MFLKFKILSVFIFSSFIFINSPVCQNLKVDRKLIKTTDFSKSGYSKRKPKYLFSEKKAFIKFNPISLIFGSAMYIYQKAISPQISSGRCIYSPSCSEFSRQLISKYGLLKGLFLSADRLMRCNSFVFYDLNHDKFDEKDEKVHESTDMFKCH